jgi:hypothetical protein
MQVKVPRVATVATIVGWARRRPGIKAGARGAVPAVIALAAVVGLAAGAPGSQAFTDTYCGSLVTAAHGSCWYSREHPSGNHSWTSNHARYSGPTPFQNCAAIGFFPKQTIVSTCPSNKADTFISYCGSPTVANKDAGVGNSDGYGKFIQGSAATGGC